MQKTITVGEIISQLKKYNPEVPFNVVVAGAKENSEFMLGASAYDDDAWYDDVEVPSRANFVELLVLRK